jgi:hypothetical protein
MQQQSCRRFSFPGSWSFPAHAVYDVTRRETFNSLEEVWLQEFEIYSTVENAIKVVVANKVDLVRWCQPAVAHGSHHHGPKPVTVAAARGVGRCFSFSVYGHACAPDARHDEPASAWPSRTQPAGGAGDMRNLAGQARDQPDPEGRAGDAMCSPHRQAQCLSQLPCRAPWLYVHVQAGQRQVASAEGHDFAKRHGALFVEASAKTNVAVTQVSKHAHLDGDHAAGRLCITQ